MRRYTPSHVLELSDETGRAPEEMPLAWTMVEEGRYRRGHPSYYTTHDWMRRLGVSEAEIAEADA